MWRSSVPRLLDNYFGDTASGETVSAILRRGPGLERLAAGLAYHADLEHPWHPVNRRNDSSGPRRLNEHRNRRRRRSQAGPDVAGGDRARIGGQDAELHDIPAHTAGHIAYHLPEAQVVFTGDTLFAMGCGRLFEGTAAQMHDALQRLAALPGETRVYCGHEYTLANGQFALTVEPDNQALIARMAEVERLRARGEPTLPSTIALERATNPFMRASSVEELAERRAAKDAF